MNTQIFNMNLLTLSIFFGIVGGIGAIFFMIVRRGTDLSIKILGSLFVLSICFAANQWFVYAIGTFIVATLVTELEFLEKLAAIAWGRKEYWDYLMQKATKSEIKKKIGQEFNEQQIISQGQRSLKSRVNVVRDKSKFVEKALEFENEVLSQFVSEGGLFPGHHVKKQVVLSWANKKRIIIDAVADGPDYFYLIEVKRTTDIRILQRAADQLKSYSTIYENYLRERNFTASIRTLIITQNFSECPEFIDDVAILQYDIEAKGFTNRKSIHDWIFKNC